MSALLVKQLQIAGVGIIRSDLIKKTLRGKIYEATLYYGDSAVDVTILYKRNGQGIVIGPKATTEEELEEFKKMMLAVLPKLPHPDYSMLRNIRTAIMIAIAISLFNIITAPLAIAGIAVNIIDLAITAGMIHLYKTESNRYVKESK